MNETVRKYVNILPPEPLKFDTPEISLFATAAEHFQKTGTLAGYKTGKKKTIVPADHHGRGYGWPSSE
ncbi:MAG: hypothetical protein Q4C43_06455 [Prevotella sp.]|nr:hypothetical protein [Prevotella sp.]